MHLLRVVYHRRIIGITLHVAGHDSLEIDSLVGFVLLVFDLHELAKMTNEAFCHFFVLVLQRDV